MKTLIVLYFCLLALSGYSQDYGTMVFRDVDGGYVTMYAPHTIKATNACADAGDELRYRVIVTSNEYAAGWAALPQARKDAAKAAAEDERTDFTGKFDKLLTAFALVSIEQNNKHQEREQAIKDAILNFADIADLRARFAAMPDSPTNTVKQMIKAVRTKYKELP